uniref:Kinase-like protein n=1 Tax=Mycena chlorophos TaxID=658473 RepID=A0ABQ0LFU2_MYCCL|nr:kinase-like protein [Mycena chlorophos]
MICPSLKLPSTGGFRDGKLGATAGVIVTLLIMSSPCSVTSVIGKELGSGAVVAVKKARVSLTLKRPPLQHEVRILQTLQGHPAIPQLVGYYHGLHFEYIAMELLGEPIKAKVKDGMGVSQETVAILGAKFSAGCRRPSIKGKSVMGELTVGELSALRVTPRELKVCLVQYGFLFHQPPPGPGLAHYTARGKGKIAVRVPKYRFGWIVQQSDLYAAAATPPRRRGLGMCKVVELVAAQICDHLSGILPEDIHFQPLLSIPGATYIWITDNTTTEALEKLKDDTFVRAFEDVLNIRREDGVWMLADPRC